MPIIRNLSGKCKRELSRPVPCLPFGAISMIRSTSMQALDHARYALLINLMRQCVLLIGSFGVISALTHSQNLIWLAVPVTEIITFLVSTVLYGRFRKDLAI